MAPEHPSRGIRYAGDGTEYRVDTITLAGESDTMPAKGTWTDYENNGPNLDVRWR